VAKTADGHGSDKIRLDYFGSLASGQQKPRRHQPILSLMRGRN
jgi:hypothetical protein